MARIVVDANVVLAAVFNPPGSTMARLRQADWAWCAPAWMWAEVEAHLPAFAARRQVTVKALRASVQAVRGIVETVHEGQMSWLAHSPLVAEATAVDPKDADYVACLIHCGATWIWSHDKDLRAAFPQFVTHNPPFRPTGPT